MPALYADPPDVVRRAFPRTWYHAKWRLLAWFPSGIFNEAFANQIVRFIEMEERVQDAPFDRYTDLSGLTAIRLKLPHVIEIARRRRRVRQPAKSAFFASDSLSFGIAQTYERLMGEAMIDVRAFPDRKAAAAWLEVPARVLLPPK